MAKKIPRRELFRVVGACIVYKIEGRTRHYLLLKRRMNLPVYPGLWTVPGGGMQPPDYEHMPKDGDGWEEPLEETVRREVFEEAGITVGPLDFLSSFVFHRPDKVRVFGHRYAAPYKSGEVRIDPQDSTEHAWLTAQEVLLRGKACIGKIPEEIKNLDLRLRDRIHQIL